MACRECDKQRKSLLRRLQTSRQEPIYMDYNATAPVLPAVMAAWEEACRLFWGHPSSRHHRGLQAWERLELEWRDIAEALQDEARRFRPFLSATEALRFLMTEPAAPSGQRGNRLGGKRPPLITTAGEHPAILEALTPEDTILPLSAEGKINPAHLEKALTAGGRGKGRILLSPVNHETGARQPLREIYARTRAAGRPLILDAVQALPRLPLSEWRPLCDGYVITGHKIGAPKGLALAALPEGMIPPEATRGCPAYRGTPPLPALAALARALNLLFADFAEEQQRLSVLTKEGLRILEGREKGLIINSPADAVPGVLNISLPDLPSGELMEFLARRGLCLSRFSACQRGGGEASPVLEAMGLPRKQCLTSLRISLGRASCRDDFFRLKKALSLFSRGEL